MTEITPLLAAFERFAYGQSLHTAFTGLLDWMLLPFKMYDNAQAQQQALETYRNHPKVNELVKLVTLIGELSEGFRDPLGELYMQAISNGHNGQYFTPEHLCDIMAVMQIGEGLEAGKTVCDPACGSGRMLLAAAKINRYARFYGADLDITCCKMALINMLLNSLHGEVAHMNTLTNDFYRGYKISTTVTKGCHYPYYTEFINADQSNLWLPPVKDFASAKPAMPTGIKWPTEGIQVILFDW